MTNTEVKSGPKRASKSDRTYHRRLKEAARKPGGALALQMTKARDAAAAAANIGKKEKAAAAPAKAPAGEPEE